MNARFWLIIFAGTVILTIGITATQPNRTAVQMSTAANAFLNTLTATEYETVMFPFDGEDRFDWHFIPRERKGLALKSMTDSQQEAALNLVRASLSTDGFDKSQMIRELEQILFEREGRAIRDRELYFFMIFGEPTNSGTWGWRYEGHHISQNWTIVDGRVIASSPQFFGTNPANVQDGNRAGTRVLSTEEDLARTLLRSLSPELRAITIISNEAPRDILTSNERQAAMQTNDGVAFDQLTTEQQEVLWSLIEEYAGVQPDPIAAERLENIHSAGIDTVRFAWMGGTEPDTGHYYRIQGATFLIEYDNVQNDANHAHSVWRDFNGDFGRDLLAAHYQRPPHQVAGQ